MDGLLLSAGGREGGDEAAMLGGFGADDPVIDRTSGMMLCCSSGADTVRGSLGDALGALGVVCSLRSIGGCRTR